jgi:hypothetical protein
MKKLKLILLFNPLMEWLDTTHAMRLYMHSKAIEEGTPPACKGNSLLTSIREAGGHTGIEKAHQRVFELLPYRYGPI